MLKDAPPNITASAAAKPAYGLTSGGLTTRGSFWPALMEFPDRSATQKKHDINAEIPLPSGWKPSVIENSFAWQSIKLRPFAFA